MLSKIPTKEILVVILGGLFGWMLGKLPDQWVYAVIAVGIVLILMIMRKGLCHN